MSEHRPSYERYMASAAWAKRRAERLEIDGHRCQTCLHDGTIWRLEVHHKTYDRLGDEDVKRDLITLCASCHDAVTNVIRSRRYDGKPVAVCFVSENSISRKDVRYGMDDIDLQDHRRRTVDHAQRGSRKPIEQGR